MIRIITWNIGSISFLKYAKNLKIKLKGQKIENEYFQPKINGVIISNYLSKVNPDIIILQEVFFEKDIESIEFLKKYPYKIFINTSYHQHAILVASKELIEFKKEKNISTFLYKDLRIIPIHLNSFHAKLRLEEVCQIENVLSENSKNILLGDTNFWLLKNFFFFKKDKEAYKKILRSMIDATKNIRITSILGLTFDKIFVSRDIKIIKSTSEKVRGYAMDHFPIYVDIE